MAGYATPAWANGTSPALSAANLLAMGQGIELAQHPFGVCSTAAGTAAKTVTIDFSGTLALFAGLRISVYFTNGNTASSPTLNVNGTGAVPIKSYGANAVSTWLAGRMMDLVYYNSTWLVVGSDGATGAVIETGSYAGMNQYGPTYPNTLNFSFVPAFVYVMGKTINQYQAAFIQGVDIATSDRNNALNLTWSGTSLSWWSSAGANYQLNGAGQTYYWVAIG